MTAPSQGEAMIYHLYINPQNGHWRAHERKLPDTHHAAKTWDHFEITITEIPGKPYDARRPDEYEFQAPGVATYRARTLMDGLQTARDALHD